MTTMNSFLRLLESGEISSRGLTSCFDMLKESTKNAMNQYPKTKSTAMPMYVVILCHFFPRVARAMCPPSSWPCWKKIQER